MSLLRRAAFLVLLLTGAAQADSLASLRSVALPSLPGNTPVEALVSAQGRPLALTDGKFWQLTADEKSWVTLPAKLPNTPLLGSVVSSVDRPSYLLRGEPKNGELTGIERLDLQDGLLSSSPVAPPPVGLHDARAALLGDVLYLVGQGADGSAQFLQHQPTNQDGGAWKAMPAWPGGGVPTALVSQTRTLLMTVTDPSSQLDRLLRWSTDKGWEARGSVPGRVILGAARPTGQAHVLMLVGDPADAEQPPALMTYQTITGSWATLARPAPVEMRDLRAVAPWKDGFIGVGKTGGLALTEVEAGKQLLRWLDWLVIAVYLAAMLGIGLYFYLQEKRNSTADFFVGGRSIPFWAAGVSLYATNTSSISFIAIPAKAFETNWQYLTNNLIAVVGLMFVAVWIVPLLRRLDLMSVFHYLETRFHPAIRMLASALCIVMQVGSRMSVVLFLPALAISTITNLDVVWSVLIMGGFTIAYTALGGMKAVVWTDFVQVFAMMGGAIFAIGFIVYQLNGGLGELWQVAMAENKTQLFDFSFDLTKATVWGFIFLVLFDVVLTFPKDQVLMQRTLSTKSDKEAGRSIWAFAAIMIPGGFVFYSIGTALYVYYRSHPERMNPLLSIDATFPLFIAAELPMGVKGLIIAGIFAAAMSTLSSIINSVATLASVDFYEKLAKNPTPKKSVQFAEWTTVAVGLAGIGVALLLSRYDIHSLFDVSIELAGLLGGGFAGAYTLGMFTKRANSQGVAIGIAGSIVLTTVAWSMSLVHPYFYLAISIMLCIVIGYIASLFFPAPTRSLKGLTIYADA
ncbi:sodium/solute symporter [soil metagenome]